MPLVGPAVVVGSESLVVGGLLVEVVSLVSPVDAEELPPDSPVESSPHAAVSTSPRLMSR
jgi:hypothetical protein